MTIDGQVFRAGSPEAGGANPPREVTVAAFSIGRTEVTCAEYAEFLDATKRDPGKGARQFEVVAGQWTARDARRPVAWVSFADAEAYCAWLAVRFGRNVRLPTEDEWECAARGGIPGARFPWGWGDPARRACFNAAGPRRVGAFDANPLGLYDMAGNVAEWCAGADPARAAARGGSWADRDADFLRVFHRALFPRDYRDGDVGFRIVSADAH